jgi:RNA polymerase sigma factor for flagellar operon FliA
MESDASWRTSDMSGMPRAARAGLCEVYRTELDEAEVVKQYAPMVTRIARHLKGRLPEDVQLDDLVQAGLIAVLRIARHTESLLAENAPLRRSVMNAMIDEARRTAWAPTRTVKLAKAAATAMRAIRRRTGRDGSDEEVAAELSISLAQYHQVLVELAGIRLLDLDGFDESREPALQITDNREELLHHHRMAAALAASIASLPERERLVVSLYYEHELNMEEVGAVLGLNKSTICRAHGRALLMLRNVLADRNLAADASQPAGTE